MSHCGMKIVGMWIFAKSWGTVCFGAAILERFLNKLEARVDHG